MRHTRKLTQAVAALAVAGVFGATLVGTAVASESGARTASQSETRRTADSRPNIVEIASASPEFSTLVSAVSAAGLVETLSGRGPFTVFAPTNEAFAKIPPTQLQAILADREVLTRILTYHVIGDRVMSRELRRFQSVETLETSPVEIRSSKRRGASIEGARIIDTDIRARNGVVHVIDTVILPPDLRA